MKPRLVLWYTLSSSVFGWLVGGFEVALILRFRDSILDVIGLQMAAFAMLFAGFRFAGAWLRKGNARGLFRFGFALQSLACGLFALLAPTLTSAWWLLPFFLLRGLADGAFSGGRSVVFLEVVKDGQRDRWALQWQTLAILGGLVIPPAAGALIAGLGPAVPGTVLPPGYVPLLAFAALWSAACAVFAPKLAIAPQDTRWHGWGRLLLAPANRAWIVLLAVGCLSGVTATLASAALNVSVLGGEFGLGVFAAWVSLLSALFFWGLHRLTRNRPLKRLPWILGGTVGELVSRVVYTVWPTLPGLGAKSMIDSFIVPFRGLLGENIVRRQLDAAAEEQGLSLAQVQYFQESIILAMRLVTGALLALVFSFVHGSASDLSRVLLVLCLPLGLLEFALLAAMNRALERPAPP